MKGIFLIFCCATTLLNSAQNTYPSRPQIGKKFTDFVLDSVYNYSKKTISYNDFKGKWIILDFWGEFCSGCIESFPKTNALQKKFSKDIQFILVTQTYKSPNTAIELFKKLQTKFDLSSPATFDQNFFNRVQPDGLPKLVIINPEGIVEAITNGLTEREVNDFLIGKNPILQPGYLVGDNPSKTYRREVPLLMNGNGGDESDYLYRSLLTKWKPSMLNKGIIATGKRLELFKSELQTLYRLAYFGTYQWYFGDKIFYGNYYPDPILEIKDSSLFQPNWNTGENLFCYSLSFSKDVFSTNNPQQFTASDKLSFQKIMQIELETTFRYVVRVETRKMPCYKLVATEEARQRLKTKGGPELYGHVVGSKSLRAVNVPVYTLLGMIAGSAESPLNTIPIIDETGIKGNIDITINAVYFDDWLKELRKQGLDVVLGEKEMKVLVISDQN